MDSSRVESKYIDLKHTPNSDVLYICFSSRNRAPGTFDKYHAPADIPASYLYLNCDNDWYHNGIPGVGGLSESLSHVRGIIKSIGANRTLAVGSSMGAFGALWYGASLEVDSILLFGPETVINIAGGHSIANMSGKSALSIESLQRAGSRITYVSGDLSPVDTYCAHYAQSLMGGDIVVLRGARHETARYLKDIGLLESFVYACATGADLPSVTVNEQALSEQCLQSFDCAPADFTGERIVSYVKALGNLALDDVLVIADFMMARKTLPAAIALCNHAIERYGPHARAKLILGDSLQKLGRYGEALDHLQHALENDPDKFRSNFALARSYDKLKQPDLAIMYCDQAIAACTTPSLDPQRRGAELLKQKVQSGLAENKRPS